MPVEPAITPFRVAFPNPSPQLQTCINYLSGIGDQDLQRVLDQLTEDHSYEWIAKGFDFLGPRFKDRKQTEDFFGKNFGNMITDYRVSCMGTIRTLVRNDLA